MVAMSKRVWAVVSELLKGFGNFPQMRVCLLQGFDDLVVLADMDPPSLILGVGSVNHYLDVLGT